MPFIKGHPQFNTGRTHFKKGVRQSPSTEFKKGVIPKMPFKKGHIPWMKGKHHSEETKIKLSIAITPEIREMLRQRMVGNKINVGKTYSKSRIEKVANANRGINSHFWKGGVTTEHEIIRHSFEYSEWRKKVFERDNYTCVLCGDKTGGNLQADHLKRFSEFPELRFDIDNGRTLCIKCHHKTENYGNYYKKGATI